MRTIYTKQQLLSTYGKFTIVNKDGKLQDDNQYIVDEFGHDGDQVVVYVEEVTFI